MLEKLSIEELSKLCGGEDFWHSHAIKEVGIPAIMMSDGPHGLRTQKADADHLGIHDSVTAICFPSASSLANSFDKGSAYRMGQLLGEEALAEGVNILLGPAINIKRTPLCGRNFEYFSEDPYLTGELAAELVKGIQSKGVGACVKHFAANNQENGRMVLSANMEERTLREIYLRAFQRVVKESPCAVMSSYNKVNGEYVGESKRLLSDILRDEWGFKGIVISDWYAVSNRVKALLAGMDLEMPGGANVSTQKLIDASANSDVKNALIKSAERIAKTARALNVERTLGYDFNLHHEAAVELACESAVLLKNNDIFPINKSEKILLVGEYASAPRYQGGGSSHINAYRVESVIENLDWADYYAANEDIGTTKEYILSVCKKYDKVIVFAGLPDECESEGYDRQGLELPNKVNAVIECVAECVSKIGVVLFNGSPVAMPWLNSVDGVLAMGLCGEGSGKACAKLLTGSANPCGKLAESYPLRIEHTPAHINSRGARKINYAEGVFVGYRYYTTKKIPTLFPFGFGLSYTQFDYSDLQINQQEELINVTVKVKNTGKVFGKETVQLYMAPPQNGNIDRPCLELIGFDKIALAVGEAREVSFEISKQQLCYFEAERNCWATQSGEYRIIVARSAECGVLSATLSIIGDSIPPCIEDNVTIGELLNYPPTAQVIAPMVKGYSAKADSDAISADMKKAMLLNAPIRLVKGIAKMDNSTYKEFLNTLKKLANTEGR